MIDLEGLISQGAWPHYSGYQIKILINAFVAIIVTMIVTF